MLSQLKTICNAYTSNLKEVRVMGEEFLQSNVTQVYYCDSRGKKLDLQVNQSCILQTGL